MPAKFFTPAFVFRAAVLFVGFLATLMAGIAMNVNSSASFAWPSVQGIILSGQVVLEDQQGGRNGSIPCYHAELNYTYTINEVPFFNNRVSYHGAPCIHGERGKRLALETLARYPLNGAATIFYDPQHPQSSCLEPGRTNDGFAMFLVSGFFFLLFLLIVGGRALDRYGGIGDFAPERSKISPGR